MEPRQSQGESIAGKDLLLYSGVLVSFLVPRQFDTALLDEAIANIKRDIEKSIEARLPGGCVAEIQNMA